MELFILMFEENKCGHMVNEERTYRYRQLLKGINNSIVAFIEQSIRICKKYQTLKNFNAARIYMAMTKGV